MLETHTTTLKYDDILIDSINKLTSNSVISRAQTTYYSQKNSAIFLMDFAENYPFVVQDEV